MSDVLSQHEMELAHLTIQLSHAEARQQDGVERVGSFAQEKKALEEGKCMLKDMSLPSS
jgi:hypothetical protein